LRVRDQGVNVYKGAQIFVVVVGGRNEGGFTQHDRLNSKP